MPGEKTVDSWRFHRCLNNNGPRQNHREKILVPVFLEKITDPFEGGQQGGRIQNYKRQRRVRRWVSQAYSEGAIPTLTLTNHPVEEPDGTLIQLDQVGIGHISFGAQNVKALADDLTTKGYELAGPAESFMNDTGEMRSIYVFDPDGILVQFNNPDDGS